MVAQQSTAQLYDSLFNHSLVLLDTLVLFHFFTIKNNDALNIHVVSLCTAGSIFVG